MIIMIMPNKMVSAQSSVLERKTYPSTTASFSDTHDPPPRRSPPLPSPRAAPSSSQQSCAKSAPQEILREEHEPRTSSR